MQPVRKRNRLLWFIALLISCEVVLFNSAYQKKGAKYQSHNQGR